MKSILTFILAVSLLNASCQKILFSDEESTRAIELGSFHAVKFSGICNIVLIQDSTNRLVITGKNDIHSLDALINNDTLVIDDHKKRSFNPARNTLVLHFSNLAYIETSDPVNLLNTGTLKLDQLSLVALGEIAEVRLVVDCNNFIVVNDANTLGYFYFKGRADNCWMWNRYGSAMYADSLNCKSATVYNQSVGDVHINASESLDAFIRASGNIYYYGNPAVNVGEKTGTGRMIRLD